jgi:hypothetical protein
MNEGSRVRTGAAVLALGLIGVPYFAFAGAVAARRHLWNDELFTYDFANLPGLSAVWHQLETGVEQTPPLFYVVTRASLALFGHNSVAIRLPETIGVFGACVCVYLLVARRTSAVAGTAAALVVLATKALPYAYEARPYGLVLGLAAAALLCWQLRADTGSGAAAVGLAVTLACAVSVHYYAALLVVPIAAAEATRAASRRRLDRAVPAALVAGLLPLLLFRPLIDGARRFSHQFWTSYDWSSSWTFFAWLLRTPAVPPALPTRVLVAGTGTVVGVSLLVLAASRALRPTRSSPAAPELAAALAFLALPLLAVALAETVTGAYTERYTLFAVLGLAILVPIALDRLGAWWRPLPALGVACLAAVCVRAAPYEYRDVSGDLARQRATLAFLEHARRSLPIVLAQPHDMLELSHYAPPSLHRRLLYLGSRRLALRYLGTDSTEAGVIVLSRFSPLHVRAYRSFVDSGRPFLLFVDPGAGSNEWVSRALAADRVPLRVVAHGGGGTLYLGSAGAR